VELLATAITSGRLVELIVLLMLLEAGVLLLWRRRSGGAVPAAGVLAMIGAGICLMLALRAALTGAGAASVGVWLLMALVAHVGDLAARWQRPRRGRPRSDEPAGGSAPQ
jgi:hypothetical protein